MKDERGTTHKLRKQTLKKPCSCSGVAVFPMRRSSFKCHRVGIIQDEWERDTLLITSSVYHYLHIPIWCLTFILQSPKLSARVATCYQWRLDYRIGAQLIRKENSCHSSLQQNPHSRGCVFPDAKSSVDGQFPSTLISYTLPTWQSWSEIEDFQMQRSSPKRCRVGILKDE